MAAGCQKAQTESITYVQFPWPVFMTDKTSLLDPVSHCITRELVRDPGPVINEGDQESGVEALLI